MKKLIATSAAAFAVAASANAANIALSSAGGVAFSGITNGSGTESARANSAATTTINDGTVQAATNTTTVDTWTNGAADNGGVDFVGVTGLTIANGEAVNNVTFHGAIFGDGGWFGTNGTNFPGQTITGVVAPTLQFTTDGSTWANLDTLVSNITTNYEAVVGAITQQGTAPDTVDNNSALRQAYTATFNFEAIRTADFGPVTDLGFRLIGTTGGNAGADNNGFIAAREFEVNTVAVPEPSSTALLGLGGLALILRRRK